MPNTILTYTAQEGLAIAEALGWDLGLNGSANEPQYKAWLIQQTKLLHRRYRNYVNDLNKPPITDIEPT